MHTSYYCNQKIKRTGSYCLEICFETSISTQANPNASGIDGVDEIEAIFACHQEGVGIADLNVLCPDVYASNVDEKP